MIRVGITGQNGFVGGHLFNSLGLFPEEFERVTFGREFFENEAALVRFVRQCDVIVHLAALNRHTDPGVIYDTNIELVHKLVNALEIAGNKPFVLFSSSSQEEKDNHYGRSKREGREILIEWAAKSKSLFSGLVIPNVFGPFGQAFYNSFIATFGFQLTHGEQPRIEVDSSVPLIYVTDLVEEIIKEIRSGRGNPILQISPDSEYKVSDILRLMNNFKSSYFDKGVIPELHNRFEVNLFNTFRSYMDIKNHYPVRYIRNCDSRGSFVEIIRTSSKGQFSFSTTLPGITRGNHFHTRKIERFSVISGKALIQLRKIGTSEILNYYLDGSEPAYVDMPIWYTHNIKNVGDSELLTNFWINEFYDPEDPDTYFETV